ncbi:MAG: hypothetical protein WA254_19760 [Candidatus Sulfotelmatobacter sp.]|jgi:hypothetical protein
MAKKTKKKRSKQTLDSPRSLKLLEEILKVSRELLDDAKAKSAAAAGSIDCGTFEN